MNDTVVIPIEQLLNCHGYYGFGGGYATTKYGKSSDGAQIYCGERCPLRETCWTKHQERTRTNFPDMTEAFDNLAKRYQGPELIKRWVKLTKQPTHRFTEPYMSTMMGNMEDGSRVAIGLAPKDRGPYTLPWPLR